MCRPVSLACPSSCQLAAGTRPFALVLSSPVEASPNLSRLHHHHTFFIHHYDIGHTRFKPSTLKNSFKRQTSLPRLLQSTSRHWYSHSDPAVPQTHFLSLSTHCSIQCRSLATCCNPSPSTTSHNLETSWKDGRRHSLAQSQRRPPTAISSIRHRGRCS